MRNPVKNTLLLFVPSPRRLFCDVKRGPQTSLIAPATPKDAREQAAFTAAHAGLGERVGQIVELEAPWKPPIEPGGRATLARAAGSAGSAHQQFVTGESMRNIFALLGAMTVAAIPALAGAQTQAAPAAPEQTKPPAATRARPALPP